MTIEQLRVFIAVAERGHVTEGPAYLNLAQSAASSRDRPARSPSRRIAVRPKRQQAHRVHLLAQRCLPEARRILAEVEHAEQTLADPARSKARVLETTGEPDDRWLPGCCGASSPFHRAYPRIASGRQLATPLRSPKRSRVYYLSRLCRRRG